MHHLIAPTVNISILLGLLVFYLRQPLRDFVKNRHFRLKTELDQARDQLKSAQINYKEFSERLNGLDSEISALRIQSLQDGEVMKNRILTEAKTTAAQMLVDTKVSSALLLAEVKEELRIELASRVLGRAEKLLMERLTGDDRVRLRHEFSRQVWSSQ